VLDVFSVNMGRVLTPEVPVFREDAIVSALLPRAREGRVSSEGLLPGGANAASVWGLYDVTGDSPLHLRNVAELVDEAPEILWWRLLNVRFVVSDRTFPADAPVQELVRESDGRALYEVLLPAPPAWVPAEMGPTRDPDAPWSWATPAFDPQHRLVLEGGGPSGRSPSTGGGTAELSGLSIGHAAVAADLPQPGVLVLSVADDPAWRVEPVGDPGAGPSAEPLRRAYGALPAAVLPAGRWRVEWTYRPFPVIVGLAVTGLALLAGVALWRLSDSPRR
jgi:hypothetical protein